MNTALSGAVAAKAAVYALAANPDMGQRLAFDEAVRVAQKHPSYDYSRAFVETAFEIIAELNLAFPVPSDAEVDA